MGIGDEIPGCLPLDKICRKISRLWVGTISRVQG